MPLPPPDIDWTAIRLAFETTDETTAAIAARFGTTISKIGYRRQRDGWRCRPSGAERLVLNSARRALDDLTPGLGAEPETSAPAPLPGVPRTADPPGTAADAEADTTGDTKPRGRTAGSATHRKLLIARLYAALDAKLAQLEARITGKSNRSGPELEREDRQLANVIKVFEKLVELTDVPQRATPARAAVDDTSADDADRLRHDIAERFARLRERDAPEPPAA